jgi:hypothetical protein
LGIFHREFPHRIESYKWCIDNWQKNIIEANPHITFETIVHTTSDPATLADKYTDEIRRHVDEIELRNHLKSFNIKKYINKNLDYEKKWDHWSQPWYLPLRLLESSFYITDEYDYVMYLRPTVLINNPIDIENTKGICILESRDIGGGAFHHRDYDFGWWGKTEIVKSWHDVWIMSPHVDIKNYHIEEKEYKILQEKYNLIPHPNSELGKGIDKWWHYNILHNKTIKDNFYLSSYQNIISIIAQSEHEKF